MFVPHKTHSVDRGKSLWGAYRFGKEKWNASKEAKKPFAITALLLCVDFKTLTSVTTDM